MSEIMKTVSWIRVAVVVAVIVLLFVSCGRQELDPQHICTKKIGKTVYQTTVFGIPVSPVREYWILADGRQVPVGVILNAFSEYCETVYVKKG